MKNAKRVVGIGIAVVLVLTLAFSTRYALGIVLPEKEKPEKEELVEKEGKAKEPQYAPGELIVNLKDGESLEAIAELNAKYNVTSTEKVFQETPQPQDTLKALKDKLASLGQTKHDKWYWQLDKDSKEYKDYIAKIDKEKEQLNQQIKAQEELITRLEQRQKRAPEGATTPNLENIYLLKTENQDTNIPMMAADYLANPSVEYAEPNYIATIQMVPNDPYYSTLNSWGQGYDDLWGLKKIQCEQAWDISQGEGAVVAVVDTGIDYNHEDIVANIWTNLGEIPNNNIDDDNNGYIDDVKGYDFAYNDNNPMDGAGHGTHVAGTIAAVANNSLGVIGVAPKAKVMAVKGLNDSGSGYSTNLANCLKYAADRGADVINNSWGGRGTSQIIEDAVNYAHSKGCVVVAAAGNSNADASYFTPAGLTNVITVASTDHDDIKSDFSNIGTKIDLAAPGGDSNNGDIDRNYQNILSLRASNKDPYGDGKNIVGTNYYRARGTSMACPHVAGVAALLISQYPTWVNDFVGAQLIYTSDNIDSLNPGYVGLMGQGRLNSYLALTTADPKPKIKFFAYKTDDSLGNNNGMVDPGEDIVMTVTLKNIWGNAANVKATLTTDNPYITIINNYSEFGDILSVTKKDNSLNPYQFNVASSCPINYNIEFTINIAADGGYLDIQKFVVNVPYPVQAGWPVQTEGKNSSSPVLGDINGDGNLEVVVGSQDGRVYAWHHNGALLAGWPKTVTTKGTITSSPALADLDSAYPGLEIVIGVEAYGLEDYIYVWHSDGTNVTGWPKKTNPVDGLFIGDVASTPAIGDIDRDGDMEIVFGSYDNNVYAFHHDGIIVTGWPKKTNNWVISSPALADFDNDGDLEIAVGSQDGYLYAWHDNGGTLAGWPIYFGPASMVISSPAIADLNDDGILEIIISVLYNSYSVLRVFSPNGMELWSYNLGDLVFSSPAIADIDPSYPYLEIVIGPGPADKVFAFHFDGTSVAGWPKTIVTEGQGFSTSRAPESSSAALGDIDGDGDMEVIIGGSVDNKIYAFHHDASLMNDWPISTNDIVRSSPALGDMDQDGDIEVVVGSFDGKVYAWDCKGNYNPNNVKWPMFRHDSHRTGDYSQQIDLIPLTRPGIPYLSSGTNPNNSGTFSISWTISKDFRGAGLKGYDVYRNGAKIIQVTTNSYAETNLAEGSYSYYIKAVDNADNISDASGTSPAIVVDKTAPTGSIKIDNDATYTNSTLVALNLLASDTGGSDLDKMQFSNDNSIWSTPETYTTTESWSLPSGDGTKTVYAKFKDGAGSWSGVVTDTIILDTTLPPTPGAPYLSSGTNPNNTGTFSLTWTASTDAESGLKEYQVYRNATQIATVTTNSYSETNLSQGSYSYFVKAVDNVGNIGLPSETSANVIVDKTPPTGSIVINSNAAYTSSTLVTLTLSAADTGGSAVSQMRFSNDNSIWSTPETYTTTESWSLPSGDGTKTVYAKFKDGAGSWSGVVTDTIILDTTKPTISSISDSPDPFYTKKGQVSKISYTLGDNLSASLTAYVYIYNSSNSLVRSIGPYTQGLGANSTTWNGKNNSGVLVANGTYKYKITATDQVGNLAATALYPVTKR